MKNGLIKKLNEFVLIKVMNNNFLNPGFFFLKNPQFILFLLFIGCAIPKKTPPIDNRPNIVFILADDQRYDCIHALGNTEIITPNLDALVAKGTTFKNTYIMGAMNGAVYAPSRAMLISGRSVFDITPYAGSNLDMPDLLLPEALSMNNYTTFHIGKWHNGETAFLKGFKEGSKLFFGGMCDHYQVPTKELESSKKLSAIKIDSTHSSVLFSNAAIEFIKDYRASNPFYLQVSFTAPHDPRKMPKKYEDLYVKKEIEVPPNFAMKHPFDNGEMDIRDEWLAGYPRNVDEVKANILAYYAMISHMDEQIGRIINALEKKGLRDNTIIIFSSDNGLAVGQHGLMGKQNLYEHSIKVPLIFEGPGIPQGISNEELVYTLDLYPTLCDLTTTETPKTLAGVSLFNTLMSQEKIERSSLVFAYKNSQRAIRKEDFKLIEYLVKGEKTGQLFDLKNDPWETTNLYDLTYYQSEKIELQKELQQGLLNYNDAVEMSAADWNVDPIPAWIDNVSPETINRLRVLAIKDRALRGFSN